MNLTGCFQRYLADLKRTREELVGKRGAAEDERERENIDQFISMIDTSIATAEQALNLFDEIYDSSLLFNAAMRALRSE